MTNLRAAAQRVLDLWGRRGLERFYKRETAIEWDAALADLRSALQEPQQAFAPWYLDFYNKQGNVPQRYAAQEAWNAARSGSALAQPQEQENAVMERLHRANGLLRAALSIAGREGVQTNWKAFAAQVNAELEAEHPLLHPTIPLHRPDSAPQPQETPKMTCACRGAFKSPYADHAARECRNGHLICMAEPSQRTMERETLEIIANAPDIEGNDVACWMQQQARAALAHPTAVAHPKAPPSHGFADCPQCGGYGVVRDASSAAEAPKKENAD